MGSGGSVWAKPPTSQRIDCLTFEDLLRVALWVRFGSAGHERWPVVLRRKTPKLESKKLLLLTPPLPTCMFYASHSLTAYTP
eukprot:2660800-Amphidinium_carterae.1